MSSLKQLQSPRGRLSLAAPPRVLRSHVRARPQVRSPPRCWALPLPPGAAARSFHSPGEDFAFYPAQQAGHPASRSLRLRLRSARSRRRGCFHRGACSLRRPEPPEVPGPGRREAAPVRPAGARLGLCPRSLGRLASPAGSFCGESLTVKPLGPDNTFADYNPAPREE